MRKPRPAHRLARLLSHERCISGQRLATALGISRSAVWKQIGWLRQAGLSVSAVPGQGYRLDAPFEPLEADLIRMAIPTDSPVRDIPITILDEVDSTNEFLRRPLPHPSGAQACLAEYQHEGRGRRGHRWFSPYGGNLYLSLRMIIETGPETLSGLALAAGTGLLDAVHAIGATEVGLKWPNDLVWKDRKLAGLLIEIDGQCGGRTTVVVGAGINVEMPAAASEIDRPWTDLAKIVDRPISRNQLAGRILHELAAAVEGLSRRGLAPYLHVWRRHDAILDRTILIEHAGRSTSATARGIDDQGRLLVETAGRRRALHAGDVHLLRNPD